MSKSGKTLIQALFVLGAVPLLSLAYESGPPAGAVAAPGDAYKISCISSGCHSGTPNSGPGSVKILLPAGNTGTYTPGQAMQIQVTVADATKAAMGFQLTARSGTAGTTQAGDFTNLDSTTLVICSNDSEKRNGTACPNSFPIQYAEHSTDGYNASLAANPRGAYTFKVTWTPPATAVGAITLYVAGNAGPVALVSSGTNVYKSTTVLQPASANTNAPSILANGIVPVGSSIPSIQPGSWAVIYGSNLATSTVSWDGTFPTTLGGASVTVNGKPAYLYFASPGQINFQAPDDTATGSVNVVVTTANGTSTSTVTLANTAPSLLTFGDAANHVAGVISRPVGFDFLGPTGSSLGFATVAAKAGDVVVLFGVGFGPVVGTAPPAGKPFSGALSTPPGAVTLRIANQTVPLDFSGLTSAGLYQFNVRIPTGLGTGDKSVVFSVGGLSTASNNVISLQ